MSERIDWVAGKPRDAVIAYAKWRDAVSKADVANLDDIIVLLKSDLELGPDARDLIADLLARHTLSKKKGGQKTPAYRSTITQGRMRMAKKLVSYYRKQGQSLEDAIQSSLRDEKREMFELSGRDRTYTDEELDQIISDDEISMLENYIKRNRK
ncbi:hypothetical protein G6M87_10410 [Rhizobium rhizogenes]|uniref:hypothetical protein n=1 Tax=Rhizobium rhizogenes TaxID=359 RepID=UPI0015721EC0|nr:hypothetical protein [Rhizobium rhizogenes]NTI22268.1 hypothetical protein [Rhizobium rhizogenes]QTG05860.1 hypothetical protein G6M87_10410 [Rhizobium rhizogenes]